MATFVLIHGGWHGGWCWENLRAHVDARHELVALDLPGHGDDPTPTAEVTAEACIRKVEAAVASARDVVLVGHSLGGVTASFVAERMPERIGHLLYVSAYVLAPGESVLQIGGDDPDAAVGALLRPAPERGCMEVAREGAAEVFYHDCPAEDAAHACSRLVSEPFALLGAPMSTTEARYGRVRKTYLQCLNDRVISPAFQKRMLATRSDLRRREIGTGHSPFYADPRALALHLEAVASETG